MPEQSPDIHPPPTRSQTGPGLQRVLGLPSAISIVVGTVIGSGVFLVPSTMIHHVGSVKQLFVVWIVAGLLSLFGALTYAELAAAMPEAGGEYVYLRAAYGHSGATCMVGPNSGWLRVAPLLPSRLASILT